MNHRVVVMLTVLLAGSGCSRKSPCDPKQVEDWFMLPVEAALPTVVHICNWPKGLGDMLKDLETVAPDMRGMIVARGISDNMSYFRRICPEAVEVFKAVALVPGEEKNAFLIEKCGLEKLGLASREEMLKADLANLLVSVILFGWMQDEKVPRAREIGRRLMGIQ